jgi:3-oxoacyl-[acyl-carrier-protein] synthase III
LAGLQSAGIFYTALAAVRGRARSGGGNPPGVPGNRLAALSQVRAEHCAGERRSGINLCATTLPEERMKSFVTNRAGRIVFPGNFFPQLDLGLFETLEQFETIVRRDFEEKCRTDDDILTGLVAGRYTTCYALLRDLATNLFWANRYGLTLYEKRPTRWRDVPRHRRDVFLPSVTPREETPLAEQVEKSYHALPPAWDEATEQLIFMILLDLIRTRKSAPDIRAVNPTVPELLADRHQLTYRLRSYDPDFPGYRLADVVEYAHSTPELEALVRHTMVLHNEHPWNREDVELTAVADLGDDDVVVVLHPRDAQAAEFIHRIRDSKPRPRPRPRPVTPAARGMNFAPVDVRARFSVMPRLEAIAVYRGERVCTNEDLIRNTAYCWSPMTADEIRRKTGIEERRYTELDLEHMALLVAREALRKSGRRATEVGAVVFCSCTSTKVMPSVATWLSTHLGISQTHASYDLLAACAGLPYGLAEAIRLLQEVACPVLVVDAEKFSDKVGRVRTSRMLFGDGAGALLIGPAQAAEPPDVEIFQTYASGPVSEVDSIVWPNPAFDNDVTVYGPDVRTLVARYLAQMVAELRALPHPEGAPGTILDAVDLVIPHQANQTMVVNLATAAGIPRERLYFNIARVGNISSASIPIAIHDAVREGALDRPMRVFTPAFGAGAAAGYLVMRLDPSVVALEADGPLQMAA